MVVNVDEFLAHILIKMTLGCRVDDKEQNKFYVWDIIIGWGNQH